LDELLDIEIADLPYEPGAGENQKVVARRRRADAVLYRVYIFLRGRDLPFVRHVTYHLHPTVTPPVQRVVRSETVPDCRLVLWLWGTFEVQGVIEDTKGRHYRRQHFLQFDRFFDDPNLVWIDE
jgi:transcription initiation factor IIF auxiliary subunit